MTQIDRHTIELELPYIPPSVNKAYFQRGRIRALSSEGLRFKREATADLSRNFSQELASLDWERSDVGFGVAYVFCAPTYVNKGYGTTTRTKYKKWDATNRVKLLEDVLVTVSGADDSRFLTTLIHKAFAESESTVIVIWEQSWWEPIPDHVARRINGFTKV